MGAREVPRKTTSPNSRRMRPTASNKQTAFDSAIRVVPLAAKTLTDPSVGFDNGVWICIEVLKLVG
jgi:hypothetical protein